MELYPKCVHDSVLEGDYSGKIITYGEMNYSGIDQIIKKFPDYTFTSFLDIGSGRGKLCLYIAAQSNILKSIGIELVTERHADAINLKEKLLKYNSITNKVQFINGDFLEYNLNEFVDTTPLVWISNLCFNSDLTNKVINKLITDMPSGTIIGCSKEYTGLNTKLSKIDMIPIKMSWAETSMVYLYKIE